MSEPAYDAIADLYENYAKSAPFKQIERHSFLQMLGALHGESVLDLACGFGFYTRLLKEKGAAKVTGIDLSSGMVGLGQTRERENPIGVSYRVADCTDLPELGPVSLVTAIWLFNYAADRATLRAMFNSAYKQLEPGGRLVAVTFNPDFDIHKPGLGKYGLEIVVQDGGPDPLRIIGRFAIEGGSPDVEVFQWSRAAYDDGLREVGFSVVEWHPFRVPQELVEAHGKAFWDDLYANSPGIGLTAQRPAI